MSLSCTNFPPVGVCNAAPETSMGSDPPESEENQVVEFRPSPLACICTVSASLCVWPGFFRGAGKDWRGFCSRPVPGLSVSCCCLHLAHWITPRPSGKKLLAGKSHVFMPLLLVYLSLYKVTACLFG